MENRRQKSGQETSRVEGMPESKIGEYSRKGGSKTQVICKNAIIKRITLYAY